MARVKSYGDVLREYEYHPEAKCADASGAPCKKSTIGLLGRRHVAIDGFEYIGKESNRLEEVEEQSLADPTAAYTIFSDPRRDDWATKVLPELKYVRLSDLEAETGLNRRTLQRVRAGQRPHAKNRAILAKAIEVILRAREP